jgi:flagellar motor switch protein FliN
VNGHLDTLANVSVQIVAKLGTCKMVVADIINLGTGSVVTFDRLVSDPVDLMLNDRPLARGEVVVVDENFGVRITEFIERRQFRTTTPRGRIAHLWDTRRGESTHGAMTIAKAIANCREYSAAPATGNLSAPSWR